MHAFLRNRLNLVGVLLVLEEGAGCLGDDHGELIFIDLFLDHSCHLVDVIGIHLVNIGDSDAVAQFDEIYSRHDLAGEGLARSGVILVAGHTRGAVIENDDRSVGLVVEHVDEGVDTRMHESGVSDDRHPVLNIVVPLGFLHAVQ